MLSIIKFKRFMICYFISIIVGFIVYTSYHGSGNRIDTTIRNNEIQHSRKDNYEPVYGDLNESHGDYISDEALQLNQEALIKKVGEELAEMTEAGALKEGDSDDLEFNEEPQSDAEMEMMMDALHYALPTHALGLEDPWPNTSSTVTPDYFLRSVAFTPELSPTSTKAPPEALPRNADDDMDGNEAVKNDSGVPNYYLDVNGGAYDDNLEYYSDEDDFEIPHIIHQTWKSTKIPNEAESWITSWSQLYPFWLHWFWSEQGFVDMLLGHFPDQYGIYSKYEHDVNKADLRKYFLIYKEGGVVTDLDLEAIRPIDEELLDKKCLLVREPEVHRQLLYDAGRLDLVTPAFMACRPGHPFFKYVIDSFGHYRASAKPLQWDETVLNSTGTMFLSEVLYQYRKFMPSAEDDVYVAPAELFLPSFDASHETDFRVKCNGYKLDTTLTKPEKMVCEWLTMTHFNSTVAPNAYTKHNWLESWKYQYATDLTKEINAIPGDITVFDR